MKPVTTKDSTARARLVAVASDLFYRKGIPSVGINEVIEKAAIARMTLCNHFSSKDELVVVVLTQRKDERQKGIAGALSRPRNPRSKVLAAFDYLAALAAVPDFRGCAFVNAAVERPIQTTRFIDWSVGQGVDCWRVRGDCTCCALASSRFPWSRSIGRSIRQN